MYEDVINNYYDYFDDLSSEDQLNELDSLKKMYFPEDFELYELNDHIQKSTKEHSYNEKQLFASMVAIWENRRFIDKNDLDNLKFFENKGI